MALTTEDAADPPAQGAHMLEVTRYSRLHRRAGRCVVESTGFQAGGYEWTISFYPDGGAEDLAPESSGSGYVSASLALLTRPARVKASFNLGLVSHATGLPSFQPEDTTAVFDNSSRCCHMFPTCRHERRRASHGVPRLMRRCELEASQAAYLRDDTVTVACVVTVICETSLLLRPGPHGAPEIKVPEPDLTWHVGQLLVSQEGADVTFHVDEEAFAAHRIILAARSPVFEAELYGSATDTATTDAHTVTVRDMRPAVFRALLHFVYTDSLPGMSGMGTEEMRKMAQDLLAAADRYAMDRLKVVCEQILARTLHVETAASTLVLADRHGCERLRRACIHFMESSDQVKVGADAG